MKKTFDLNHEKIKVARRVDAIKHEIKKYLKRERNKALVEGADFWDFDCKFGLTEAAAETVHVSVINKSIDQAVTDGNTSFYVEVIAKPGFRRFIEETDETEETEE
ncbi:DUF6172 family protein [Thalassotalea sp. PLHSN55]|uniref:DUF6172 family protein n=1 Tax=Thalassotalea sp. PLHSN55 TaxID=3435888 RepID=UPI003F83C910